MLLRNRLFLLPNLLFSLSLLTLLLSPRLGILLLLIFLPRMVFTTPLPLVRLLFLILLPMSLLEAWLFIILLLMP